jgi:hypothetical protein
MVVSVESLVVAADDHLTADLQGDAVVLALDEGMYYELGGVGSRIWELVRERRRVSEIRDVILAEYDVDATTCQRDIIGFLERLEAEGLLVVSDETAG